MARKKSPIPDLTAKWEPEIRKAFLEAVGDIKDKVSLAEIVARLQAGDIEGAVRAVGVDPSDYLSVSKALAAAFDDGGTTVAGLIPTSRDVNGALLRVRFDVRSMGAEAKMRFQSSRLVTEIVSDQTIAIRNALTQGLVDGVNPRTSALDLVGRINAATGRREGGVIGLTSGQEAWQRRYAAELASNDPVMLKNALSRGLRDQRFDRAIQKAIKTGEPIPADTRSKMMTAYRNASLKYRADVISRNETIRALGAAQAEAYDQAIEKKQIAAEAITKFWLTAGDARVRPEHQAIPGMNAEGRAWGENFETPTGPSMHAPHDTDIQCRCYEIVRVNFMRGLK